MTDTEQMSAPLTPEEQPEWTLKLEMPPFYNPQELSTRLREIADLVDDNEDPLLGELWSRDGRLLAEADVTDDEPSTAHYTPETERQAKQRREDHEPANGMCTCQFPNECLFEAGYKAAPVENVRLRFRLQACEPRGECPVCGGETDHVDTCEVGMLSREAERLRELLSEVAIPSLRYCEEKYDHDDQARLNLEAGLRRAALAPDHSTGGEA